MVLTVKEYAAMFPCGGKRVSSNTIRRKAIKGMLPSNHKARRLAGKTGLWVIEILDKQS